MSLYLSGVAFVFVSNAFYVGLGDMAKISYPDILMAKSRSQFYHDSLVFHTGRVFCKSRHNQGHSFAYQHMISLYLVPGSSK